MRSVARFVGAGGTLIWIDGVRATTDPLLHEVLGVARHVKWWGGKKTLALTRAGKARGLLSRIGSDGDRQDRGAGVIFGTRIKNAR